MSRKTKAKFSVGFWMAAAWIALLLLIGGLDRSGRGRDVNNHYGPVPAHVLRLTSRNYVVLSKAGIAVANDLCKGTDDSESSKPVDSIADAPVLSGVLVTCNIDQTWNDHRPMGQTFWAQQGPMVTNFKYQAAIGGLLLIAFLPGLVSLAGDGRRHHRHQRERKRQAERAAAARETKRHDLAAAYAKGDITEEQWERGIQSVENWWP